MKPQKSALLVAALVLSALLTSADAQDTNPLKTGERPAGSAITNRALLRIERELHLSDQQKTNVSAVLECEARQIRELRTASSLSPAQRREKYAAIREESARKMKQVLTPEQQAKWQELQSLRGRRSPAGSSGRKLEGKKSE